jgi:acyl-CoA synthetase (AMP-forming)/AMP-acid ligase II
MGQADTMAYSHIQAPERAAEIPDIDLVSFTLRHAMQLGDKPALVDGASGHTLGYAELARAVHSFAAGLAARGFGKGDTFGIWCPTSPSSLSHSTACSPPAGGARRRTRCTRRASSVISWQIPAQPCC